ncbi:collagen alpha-1(XXI) chain-like [Corticium candelabrum]|uniref:collagen alpha-1(XXI) chain-like n=1 Tax=Corticium candelabrum TaxID=121492 RepID=UPI002E25D82F|nr:collagen alpha-1(XXI) chain-like [Corticium candelabrum]
MSSSEVDESCKVLQRNCGPTGRWTIALFLSLVVGNFVFSGFLLWKLSVQEKRFEKSVEKLQLDLQELQVEKEEMKQVYETLSEYGGERGKRSEQSPSQSSQVTINIAHVFGSFIKQMCKPESAICIPGQPGRDGLPGLSGKDGSIGLPGAAGIKGEAGRNGEPGSKGLSGKQGPRGIAGRKGDMGVSGEKGERGERGVSGLQGILGPRGEKGEEGDKGERGYTGFKGEKGERGVGGLQGILGPRGEKGEEGDKGERGYTGFKGEKGERGERVVGGLQGILGPRGEKGEEGDKGERGYPGFKGEKGGKGEIGLQGGIGMKGNKGINGMKGKGDKGYSLPSQCLSGNHRVLNETWRQTSEHYTKTTYHCDRTGDSYNQHRFTPGWHSFSPTIGGAMPEKCTSGHYCATQASGWLKGSHPNVIGQKISRTVCFSWSSNCCEWQTSVEVINCGQYYIYNLPNTPACYLAYCARGQ